MGILRDTYIINDNRSLTDAVRYSNHLAEEQFEFEKGKFEQELKHKDRVDISLNDYKAMLKEIESQKDLIKSYQNFFDDLGKKIRVNPEILLEYKLVHNEVSRSIERNAYQLHLVFEIEEKELYR